MLASQVLAYILSFFLPPFGFITFWVFGGKQEAELKRIASGSFIASFIGVFIWAILAAVGVTLRWF